MAVTSFEHLPELSIKDALNLHSKLQPPRSSTGSIDENDTRALSKDPLCVNLEGNQDEDEHRGLLQLQPVEYMFKFMTGTIANSGSTGKFKASLGNDTCAIEFTSAANRLSKKIEMSCPKGTLPSPLKVLETLTTDGWFLGTVKFFDGLGNSWDSFGLSKVWVDAPPYGVSETYRCTNALPCDVREFTPYVDYKFKFTIGTIEANLGSTGKIKASLGNDACAVEFTPAANGLSQEIEMSCPKGTLPCSPLRVEALGTDC